VKREVKRDIIFGNATTNVEVIEAVIGVSF